MYKKYTAYFYWYDSALIKYIVMTKIAFLIILLSSSQLSASVFAQRINVSAKSITLKEIVSKIGKQSGYHFLYMEKDLKPSLQIAVQLENATLEQALEQVLVSNGLKYTIRGKRIIVEQNKNLPTNEAKPTAAVQERKIKGTVYDSKRNVLAGVTVKVDDGSASSTNANGVFEVQVSANAKVVFDLLGFEQYVLQVGASNDYVVTLTEKVDDLDEVVVVGYGTQKKTNLTGSVEVVTSKSLENRPVTSPSAMLQGQVAGLTFNTASGGNTPGSNMTIQIRGQAALSGATPPLVVIDGIPADMGAFNALNPNSIESISVLKDAAATAVYGARAPYGVLVVNTKMGNRNERAKISYSGNFGMVTPVRVPETVDSYTFALSRNQAALNARQPLIFDKDWVDLILDNINNPGKYTDEELNPVVSGRWEGKPSYNNDFLDVWLRSSFRQQHDIALQGGGDNSSYFVSAAYVHQPGNLNFVEKFDNYKRFNLNGGLIADVGDWLKVTYRSRYSNEVAKEPTTEYNAGRERLYTYAYATFPMQPVYNPDGSLTGTTRIAVGANGGERLSDQHRIDNILAMDLSLAKGLTAHVDGTWRMNFRDYQALQREVYGTTPTGDTYLMDGTQSILNKQTALNKYWTLQAYAAYEKEIGKHTARIQLGAQAEENTYRLLSGHGKDLFIQDLPSIAIAQGDRTISDAINDWATAGFFGRINYNYDERYLVEINGRQDGSGRYARGQRWGFFPSGSVGWVMSRENFWEQLSPVVNFAKWRMSYGTLGNQGNSAGYLHVPTMSVAGQTPWIFDGERLAYVQTPGILNMNRTWEKITTTEVGLELAFLKSKLTAEANYFNRRSWDIIGPPTPKPSVLGAGAPQVNNAEFVTKGVEVMLNWKDQIKPNWRYNVGLTLADGKSTITKYNTTVNSISGWYVGKEMGEIWGYKVDRLLNKDDFLDNGKLKVDQSKIHALWNAGDVKYEDLDKDGTITTGTSTVENPGDLAIIGNTTARYRYGINLGTEFDFERSGTLSLSVLLEGVGKRNMFIDNSYFYWGGPPAGWESSRARSVYKGEHLDYYRDETTQQELLDHLGMNIDSYFPRPYESSEGNKNMKTNSRYLLNAAYMRLKSFNVAYTLPKEWTRRAKVENCRIYFAGENMFVLSNMPSYLDPETVGGGRMYPQQAVYSFGINVGF